MPDETLYQNCHAYVQSLIETFRGRCSCGWMGHKRTYYAEAHGDVLEHTGTLVR